jgi:hypothetical protein
MDGLGGLDDPYSPPVPSFTSQSRSSNLPPQYYDIDLTEDSPAVPAPLAAPPLQPAAPAPPAQQTEDAVVGDEEVETFAKVGLGEERSNGWSEGTAKLSIISIQEKDFLLVASLLFKPTYPLT